MPDLAATLSTQAEEANDENVNFLLRSTELPDEEEEDDFRDDEPRERRRRLRDAVDAMVEPRVYTVSQRPQSTMWTPDESRQWLIAPHLTSQRNYKS